MRLSIQCREQRAAALISSISLPHDDPEGSHNVLHYFTPAGPLCKDLDNSPTNTTSHLVLAYATLLDHAPPISLGPLHAVLDQAANAGAAPH